MAVEENDHYNNIGGPRPQKLSAYELSREKRIRENLERMQKMGILDLTRTLRTSSGVNKKLGSSSAAAAPVKGRREDGERSHGGLLQQTPLRRSSRLQNATPVAYSEILLSGRAGKGIKHKKGPSAVIDKKIVLTRGPRPEFYTEEHEKLLGNTERTWELFVDGYGEDRRRIYDPFKGKTCHQCRQKTLGHRTECSQCGMVQGQFCGDCLYMRYGEHVLEALENPNWICPVCRGICNCSLCRQANGWAPTGAIYRKVSSMGFKSVAHYLVETRRAQLKLETNADSPAYFSMKRSLPFSNSSSMDPPENNMGEIKPSDIDLEEVDKISLTTDGGSAGHRSTKRRLDFFSDGNNATDVKSLDHQKGDGKHSEDQGIIAASITASNDSGLVKKHGFSSEQKQDSIGERSSWSRKRLLCSLLNGCDAEPEQPLDDQKGSEKQNEDRADSSVTKSLKQAKNRNSCRELDQESIGGRLKLRKTSLCFLSDGYNSAEPEKALDRENGNEDLCTAVTDSSIANSSTEVDTRGYCREAGEDSIGGRLRLRKNIMLWA